MQKECRLRSITAAAAVVAVKQSDDDEDPDPALETAAAEQVAYAVTASAGIVAAASAICHVDSLLSFWNGAASPRSCYQDMRGQGMGDKWGGA